MAAKSKAYSDFGGRGPDQNAVAIPAETDLANWASFSAVQAQAFLVTHLPNLYSTKESKRSLMCSKKLFGSPVTKHNKDYKAGEDKYITVLDTLVSPMHLFVQHSYYQAKVADCWHTTE